MATTTFSPSAPAQTSAPARPFLIDGLFCTAIGAVCALASGPISTFMGLPSSLALVVIGGMTFIYGLVLSWWAASRPVPRSLGWMVMALNDVWVIASLALLVFNLVPLTDGGRWIVLLVAVDVAALSIWQWLALWRG